MTVVLLYGPKGAGKSQVADILRADHGVAQVDADALVLDLVANGVQPDPKDGWLAQVEEAVIAALQRESAVSVEATGASDSDWRLTDDMTAAGQRVMSVWVIAPLKVTLDRLARRTTRKAPVTEDEARSIWIAACARAEHHRFDLVLDTHHLRRQDLPKAVRQLADMLSA